MNNPDKHPTTHSYPRELEETVSLPDGRRLRIRPVRPQDEPALQAAFATLSAHDIRMRFMYRPKELTHEMAARFTHIDYDRELALVVHEVDNPRPECSGVVRMVADPDGERAEFAIIITRPLTGIGLGSLLMRRIIDYARKRGIKELFGDVLSENEPMLRLSDALGFHAERLADDGALVRVTLRL